MTLRVLVVGTGFGGRVVAPVFAAIPGCEVVGVVGARDESAIVDALRSTRPDLVSIQSPPFLHRRHVELALGHGVRGVLCDKPFGIDAAESEAMLTAARSSGVVHLVNFEFRCDPLRRQLRDLVRSDRLGPIEHIVWTHWSSGSRVPLRPYGWLFDRSRGGGWIGAWGAHAIDTLRWLLDDELAVVTSVPRTVIAERPDTDGMQLCTAEDSMTAVLRSVRGTTTITIDSSFAHPVNIAPRLVVLGASGSAELTADRRLLVRLADGGDETIDAPPVDAGVDRHLVPMQRWASRVVAAVTGDGDAYDDGPATFDDGVAVARVLDALRA